MATHTARRQAAWTMLLGCGLALAARAQTAPSLGSGMNAAEEEAQERAQIALRNLQGQAQEADERLVGGSALSPLPIREVTVFKDGHAFVLHQGRATSDARGQITLGGLPSPILGTFWPFAMGARLQSATASVQDEVSLRNVQSIRDLLKANIGAQIIVLEANDKRYEAKILGVPQLDAEASVPGRSVATDEYGRPLRTEIILLQTEEGVRAAPISSIQNVIFKAAPRLQASTESRNTVLRLQLNSVNQPVQVGAVYLQRGLRWIPNYRLQLGTQGRATMKLQATLVNELANLRNVSAHLAIGVPSFAFRDTLDPIALPLALAQASPSFDAFNGGFGGGGGFGGRRRNEFSNAIQTQVTGAGYGLAEAAPRPDDGPTVGQGAANEDFFFFDVQNLSLKKGERSVFALAQSELKYQDIYVAQSPAAPPPQVYQALNSEQQRQVLAATRAQFMHKLRISNTSRQPLTTAPTLIERQGQLLAQTLMTYTATGGRSDIDLAPAVDLTLKRSEDEVKRTPDALTYNDNKFSRVDVKGKLVVTSFRAEPVTVEITRQFVGRVEEAGVGEQKGTIRQVGAGDDAFASGEGAQPDWWRYTNDYWRQVNPLSSVTWTLTLPAKGTVELPYKYFYFWR